MENHLNDLMTKIPDHKLPMSYFDAFETNKHFVSPLKSEKNKKSRKRLKSADVNQTSDLSKIVSQQSKKNNMILNHSLHTIVYREIDIDVLLLIRVKLNFVLSK